jgi:hypothetical protein
MGLVTGLSSGLHYLLTVARPGQLFSQQRCAVRQAGWRFAVTGVGLENVSRG